MSVQSHHALLTPDYDILVRLSEAAHNVRENPTFETAFVLREVVDELKEHIHFIPPSAGLGFTVAIRIG